jgi:uncharacterized damage-inducible protein DinB
MLISEWMATELASEMDMTQSLLARIPDEMLNWQPTGDLHSVVWNAAHLVEIISWVPGILSESEFDIAPAGEDPSVSPEVTQTKQLLESFHRHRAEAISALQGVEDSVMDEPWSLKMGGQVLFTMKKGDCLRKWVFSHSAHHRGILSAYLRMSGLVFPSIYEE